MYKKTNAANVKEYINNTPMPQRHRLSQIYKIIQIALPVREEKISYDMPAILYKGKCCFTSQHKTTILGFTLFLRQMFTLEIV